MSSLNQCSFVGRMGRDPEVRKIPSGSKVAEFGIACTEKFKDANGQTQEVTEWVSVVAWKKLAEIIERIGKKGQLVLVVGKMKTKSWEDPNGIKKYKTEIIASQWQILNDPNFKSQNNSHGCEANGYANDVPPALEDEPLPF